MIRTGKQYRESLRDGREVYMDGKRVDDVTTHPQFKPLIDIRARIYDLQHEAEFSGSDDLRGGWRTLPGRQSDSTGGGALAG